MIAYRIILALFIAAPVFAATIPATGLDLQSRSLFEGLDKHEVQRRTAARIALARARAARKSKRALHGESANDDLVERNINEAFSSLGLSRREFEETTLTKRQLPRMRCSTKTWGSQARADKFCVNFYRSVGVKHSGNAAVTCDEICRITCPIGYTQLNSDFNVLCIANVQKCKGKKCSQDPNGVTGCSLDSGCSLRCTTSGYQLNRQKNACISLRTDPNNCGREGNRCPSSYDRKYAAACANGKCTLACPRGYSEGFTKRGRRLTCVPA